MREPESQYLVFEGVILKGHERKTKIFKVLSKYNALEPPLGYIKWHPAWRRYVFNTECAIFDVKCLTDVIAFINYLMEERKIINAVPETR